MFRTKLSLAATACALLAGASVAAIANGDEEPPLPGDGIAQVTTIQQDALDAVATLQETRTATDALPPDVAEPIGDDANFGLNPDLSRLAIGQTTNSVYLLPANDHICVALTAGEGVGMTCPPTDQIADGEAGPIVGTVDGGALAIFGVVPDGVESVTIETGESDSDVIEVAHNAYYTAYGAGTDLRHLSYVGPSGEVSWPIQAPAVVFDDE